MGTLTKFAHALIFLQKSGQISSGYNVDYNIHHSFNTVCDTTYKQQMLWKSPP